MSRLSDGTIIEITDGCCKGCVAEVVSGLVDDGGRQLDAIAPAPGMAAQCAGNKPRKFRCSVFPSIGNYRELSQEEVMEARLAR